MLCMFMQHKGGLSKRVTISFILFHHEVYGVSSIPSFLSFPLFLFPFSPSIFLSFLLLILFFIFIRLGLELSQSNLTQPTTKRVRVIRYGSSWNKIKIFIYICNLFHFGHNPFLLYLKQKKITIYNTFCYTCTLFHFHFGSSSFSRSMR